MTINRIKAGLVVTAELTPENQGATGGIIVGLPPDPLAIPTGAANKVTEIYSYLYDPATAADNAKAWTITNTDVNGTLLLDTVVQNDADGNRVNITKLSGTILRIRRTSASVAGAAAPGTITLTSANWAGLPASRVFDCAADIGEVTDYIIAIGTSATLTLTASASNCGLTAELIILGGN